MWSISSWWRYDNLCSNFTKNNYPWVGWSIWVSRLISVLNSLWKIEEKDFLSNNVLVINSDEKYEKNNLEIVKLLRNSWIKTEIYLDFSVKMQKQLKYANNKKIKFVIICLENEINSGIVQVKNMFTWEQKEVSLDKLIEFLK